MKQGNQRPVTLVVTQKDYNLQLATISSFDSTRFSFPTEITESRNLDLHIVNQRIPFYCFTISNFRYLEGGVDSGFVKVDRDAYRKRLLHVKGKRNIRIEEVRFIL